MVKTTLICFILTFLVMLTSCGGKNSSNDNTSKVVEFNLTGDDQMQFNLKSMVVKQGETVKVNFENIGVMAKEVMGHNFVLLKQGIDIAGFAAKAAAAKENEYIPSDSMDDIIIYSKLLGPGEKTVVEFEAPTHGTYKFLCSFPGHYITMQGNLIVR